MPSDQEAWAEPSQDDMVRESPMGSEYGEEAEVEPQEMAEHDHDPEELQYDEEAQDEGEGGEGLAELTGDFQQQGAESEINVNSFEELRLDESVRESAQEAWRMFLANAASREVAGEQIYGALFESAPSLQSLFTTPRAVQAMRFMNGLNNFVTSIDDPPALKILVETLGFGHLNLEVTVPRVVIFRDAILDLFQVELGERLTTAAYLGWKALLNYVGGAIIFIKANYAERLKILDESWALANDRAANNDRFAVLGSKDGHGEGDKNNKMADYKNDRKSKKNKAAKVEKEADKEKEESQGNGNGNSMVQHVPTTFPEMFTFNAAVMGFGNSFWMNEVLACFHAIVTNAANSGRLQEECDVLVLRISKVASGNNGKVNLGEYKSCMLASLRSLLPKDWSGAHEVAWTWLWENVERLLLKTMGQPPAWEKAYAKFVSSLDESQAYEFRANVYAKFFALAPSGEDYFKQSNTYLHLIANKILEMVLDMYREPVRMTDDISALGLRHVGYGIPTEFFAPFVSAVIEVLNATSKDEVLIEATRWSLGLIGKSLVRTILEGSTIVMKAINVNTKKSIAKAISCAPRGDRNQWMLVVAVGTQNISPLAWSIEGGKIEAASEILKDLTTFRADRDRYYYGADELFTRHPDLVKKLCDDAPVLLPQLLDGLIWRSRLTHNGQRRVNYYLKHMLINPDGEFHKTLSWVVKLQDPKLVCHPALALLTDLVWAKVASQAFLFRKSWFLFTLVVFISSQSVLGSTDQLQEQDKQYAIFACRIFIYVLSMGQMAYVHGGTIIKSYLKKELLYIGGVIPIPKYLENWQDSASLVLLVFLITMLASEPIIYCLADDAGSGGVKFTESCDKAESIRKFPYSTFSMLAMFSYYTLLIDLAVFSTKFSSYVLACGRMLSEVALFLLAMFIAILTFASSFSCLDQDNSDFHGIQRGAVALWELALGFFTDDRYNRLVEEAVVLYGSYAYLIVTVIFLQNILIAQLSCSYGSTYMDMIGFARLRRMRLIVETMTTISEKRWVKFVDSLKMEEKLEFNEGDVGLSGGIQIHEPASLHPTTVDMIQRFGGSTSPSVQWPDNSQGDDDTDRYERLEKMLQRAMSKSGKSGGKTSSTGGSNRHGGGSGAEGSAAGSSAAGSQMGSQGGGSGADREGEGE